METMKYVKLVVYVPEGHADAVRTVLGEEGAGRIGNYSHCSFSLRGVGRFTPLPGADPVIGEVGVPEEVAEERIETICEYADVGRVVERVRAVHPYEHMAYDVYPLLSNPKK